MNRYLFAILSFILFSTVEAVTPAKTETTMLITSNEAGLVRLSLPVGWGIPDTSAVTLPPHVLLMVVGQGQHAYPPSMNLTYQSFKGTLKQYLKNVKAINEAKKDDWKDLGTIRTESGNASLSQVDSHSEWGDTKSMHVILLKNDIIYILTVSALKEEFSKFYKNFFTSMQSLQIGKEPSDLLNSPQRKSELKKASQTLQKQWQVALQEKQQANPDLPGETLKTQVFDSENFQSKSWGTFKELITQKFADMGTAWHNLIFEKMKAELFESK